jgi:L-asparaginase
MSGRKRVYLIYTGGTVGMLRTPQGYAPASGFLAEQLATMPELKRPELPDITLHAHDPLLDSADMRPSDWNRIAADVAANYDAYDGFVILHGTDTMAYTASALSFLLENLAKPVILTGSQIPLVEVRSDARDNLITSLLLATEPGLNEVGIYLNGRLLRGNRSTKVNAAGFDAFASPNFPPLAEVGVDIAVRRDLTLLAPSGPFTLHRAGDDEVAALRLFPGLTARTLRNALLPPVVGLVLESYGGGNAPSDPALLAALAEATARGVVIVNCTQCLRGRVDMADYATGQALEEAGVVSGSDMTAEAALAKLVHLFGLGLPPDMVRERVVHSLRGEATPVAPS